MLINDVILEALRGSEYGLEGKPEWYDRAVQMKLNNPRISAGEIARQVGASGDSVIYWLTGKDHSRHRWAARPKDSFPFTIKDFPNITGKKYWDGAKPEWYDQALQMAKAGETFTAIGKKFGVTVASVSGWLVKGQKNRYGKLINPDAELEPRRIVGQKLDINLINSFIKDWGLTDEEIIELVKDEKGSKIAKLVKDRLPDLRAKLKAGVTKNVTIDKTTGQDLSGLT